MARKRKTTGSQRSAVSYQPTPERINPVDGILLRETAELTAEALRAQREADSVLSASSASLRLNPVFRDDAHGLWLYQGNCLSILDAIAAKHPEGCFDAIFADPPYFLSNGGITCHAGKMVSVHKGDWDRSRGAEENHNFNRAWLERCQRVLKPNGTIWVTGTHHVIFSVGYAMQQLGFKLLNDIAWEKPNPPLNWHLFNNVEPA